MKRCLYPNYIIGVTNIIHKYEKRRRLFWWLAKNCYFHTKNMCIFSEKLSKKIHISFFHEKIIRKTTPFFSLNQKFHIYALREKNKNYTSPYYFSNYDRLVLLLPQFYLPQVMLKLAKSSCYIGI